jgi:hypothetical protein
MSPEKLGFAVSGKRQRTSSVATLPASIELSRAARVPSRSAFGSVHVAGRLLPPQPVITTADRTKNASLSLGGRLLPYPS